MEGRDAWTSALLRCLAAGAMLLCVAACSENSEPATPAPSASSNGSPSGQSAPPRLPSPVSVAGVKQVPLKSREDLRLTIQEDPDWMTTGFGSLWVQRSNGSVVRISKQGKQIATIDAELYQPPTCGGIGVSADAIWACATQGKIVRIDPATNAIVDTVSVPKINEQGRLTAIAGRLWLLTGDGDQLVGLSLADNSLGEPIQLGTFCTDLGAGTGRLVWVACSYEGMLLRVDPVAGKVTGRLKILPGATAVATADDVWVGFDGGVAQVNPESLEVQRVYDIPLGVTGGIRATADDVWLRQEDDPSFTRIDPVSGEVVEAIVASDLSSSGDVIDFGGAVWASFYDDQTVLRITD